MELKKKEKSWSKQVSEIITKVLRDNFYRKNVDILNYD